jgi:hypothetical protein
VKHIIAENADIWVFTESHRTIRPDSDFHQRFTVGSDRKQADGEVWTGISSRFPIVDEYQVCDPIRSLCVRVQTPLGDLIIYGTVLPWLSDQRYWPKTGFAAFEHVLEEQVADWLKIQQAHPGCGFCLAGDLNQDLSHRHYYGSKNGRETLKRSLAAAQLHCLTSGTSDPVEAATAGKRSSIDHICVTPSWSNLAQKPNPAWPKPSVVGAKLSDHFGVSVDFAHPIADARSLIYL